MTDLATPATTTSAPYKPAARALHWSVALLVIATIPVGALMVEPGWARPTQDAMFVFHKNAGVLILLLMILRLAYRAMNPPPPLPATVPPAQQKIAEIAHWALYVMVLVMAVSGYVRVAAGGFPLEVLDALGVPRLVPRSDTLAEAGKTVHAYARFVLAGLIVAHVGAAAYHGLVKRDGVFSRMWPGRG
jgi:cytochrome b561